MALNLILKEIETNTKKILDDLEYPIPTFTVEISKSGFGDFTCNVAFLLAKQLKKKPFEIASILASKYENFLGKYLQKVEPHQSGYLNFFANHNNLNSLIINNVIDAKYGTQDIGNNQPIIIEHTSVNPNKALHIGHIRNIVIGDTLARILRNVNYDVKVLNYVDDSGLQVADIIIGFKYAGFSETPPNNEKFDHYCGDSVYVKTTEKYSSDKKLEEYRTKVLQELEDPNSEISKFGQNITRKVLAEQLKTCWHMGVTYDCLNFESQIIHSNLWTQIFEKMKSMNLTQLEKDGKNANCWVIESKSEEDKVLVRSNGVTTYIAKDIPYAAWKLGILDDPFFYKKYATQNDGRVLWETIIEETLESKLKFSANKVITVIDSRQSRLQKIITKLMSKFTSDENSYLHLSYESVTLSADTVKSLGLDFDGKEAQMSGRKGIYINADSIFESLEKKVFDEAKKRNPDLDDSEISKIAHSVAIGTIRYEMIKQDLDKIITFDANKSLSLEGDTCSYIQYSYARASRILEKANKNPDLNVTFDLINSKHELELLKNIGKFEICVNDSVKNLSPKVIARLCYDLAVSFNVFYEHVHVLNAETPDLVNARLCLVHCYKIVIEKSLSLLGILTPSRM